MNQCSPIFPYLSPIKQNHMKVVTTIVFLILLVSASSAQQTLKSSQYVSLKSTIEVKSDTYETVYTGPEDSCLIVTDVFIYEPGTTPLAQFVYENDAVVLRVQNGEWLNLTTGILFKSGSQVNFKNTRAMKNQYSYNISGYLIKQE